MKSSICSFFLLLFAKFLEDFPLLRLIFHRNISGQSCPGGFPSPKSASTELEPCASATAGGCLAELGLSWFLGYKPPIWEWFTMVYTTYLFTVMTGEWFMKFFYPHYTIYVWYVLDGDYE
jgi:hypothetical protein